LDYPARHFLRAFHVVHKAPSMVLSLFLVVSAIALLTLTRCYLKCSPPA
jgi:hypothetical protein